jgi:hypothetical protein
MKLLRIEAVNLAYSIEDTEDLKTRRGGSFILLDAIQKIESTFKNELKPISTGASAGLFEVCAENHALVAEKVRKLLATTMPESLATFVVSVVSQEATFSANNEALIASNRWQQMQSLSFSGVGLGQGSTICDEDEIRPTQKKESTYSASVEERRQVGLKLRQKIYQKVLGDNHPHFDRFRFSDDFGGIAKGLPKNISPETLDGKLAIFYADGNKFGRFSKNANSPEAARKWDSAIKQKRRQFISELMDKTAKHSAWNSLNGSISRLRMEVLLWGGDELMLAVPGWCGLQLAQYFFDAMKGWKYPAEGESEMLYHAASLVLCHHQAPISAVSDLARRLADIGKDKSEQDSLTWLTLESFDHTGDSLDDYLDRRYPHKFVTWPHLQLNPHSLEVLVDKLPALKEVLPKSQLHRIARRLNVNVPGEALDDSVSRSYEFVAKSLKTAGKQNDFNDLWKVLGDQSDPVDWTAETPTPTPEHLSTWILLLELWDYCLGTTSEGAA